MNHRTERTILTLILIFFTILGITYSIVVPPFEASDELWHYPMVKYIADHWTLPVQEPGVETPWRQEGSQPPLYYALAAAATFWIDTSDMDVVRHINRHADNGVATPDGNTNLIVHHPVREAFPWRGTILAIHLIRILSVLMGTVAVYLTYLIAREVLPDQPGLALGTAAIHAFTPMYVFISGSVNNDNLVVPLSNLGLLMLLRLARQREWTPRQSLIRYIRLGIVLGLAALTKTSALALAVLTALVVTVRAVRRRSWTEFLMGGFATLLPMLAVAGWWFLRNLQLYGDLTGFNLFFEVLGTREIPADVAQMWRERYSFAAGYWGNFGGLNVPMPAWVYGTLNTLAILAAIGLIVGLVKSRNSNLKSQILPFLICVLWGLGILLPWLLWWARITWSSQGRLVFTAISTWALLLALGLAGWLPRRWGQWAVGAFALLLLGLSLAAPIAWIKPAYALPKPLTDTQAAAIPHKVQTDFGSVMQLRGYNLETTTTEPGGQVEVTLYWQALAPADQDYTVFVQLLGEGDLLVAQRDTFPGLGRLSTTWLEPGFRWADRYVLQVPDTAYTPDTAQIQVGLYDPITGMRLITTKEQDNVRFGQVQVRARPGDVPNPISVNFGDRIALIGYDLDQRVVDPGEIVTMTLHWKCLQKMNTNYNISVQFINAAQNKAAQHDGWPLEGAAPTVAWEPGQTLVDTYALPIHPDTQPGVYDVRVVVYALGEDGQIIHLPTVPAGGQMQASHVTLTTMKVAP
ncbi:MAG: glycosyltransferase family 39 protein [Chloroflexi bacterium]|nr:glycosyltransferase family 39 protein [Chloroflexota bacterium]